MRCKHLLYAQNNTKINACLSTLILISKLLASLQVALIIEAEQAQLVRAIKLRVDAIYIQRGSGYLDCSQILSEF